MALSFKINQQKVQRRSVQKSDHHGQCSDHKPSFDRSLEENVLTWFKIWTLTHFHPDLNKSHRRWWTMVLCLRLIKTIFIVAFLTIIHILCMECLHVCIFSKWWQQTPQSPWRRHDELPNHHRMEHVRIHYCCYHLLALPLLGWHPRWHHVPWNVHPSWPPLSSSNHRKDSSYAKLDGLVMHARAYLAASVISSGIFLRAKGSSCLILTTIIALGGDHIHSNAWFIIELYMQGDY